MTTNLLYNPSKSQLDLLEWDTIISQITNLAYFETSISTLKNQMTFRPSQEILQNYDKLDYFFNHLEELSSKINTAFLNINNSQVSFDKVDSIQKNMVFSIKDLNFFCHLIEAHNKLYKSFRKCEQFGKYELPPKPFRDLNSNFVSKLRDFVDPTGVIDYNGHPELREINQKLKSIDENILQRIKKLKQSSTYSNILQFQEHDIINDRYVLAIRSDSYRSTMGNIVAKSNSGLTLFVEPAQIKKEGNQRIQLMAKIEEVLNKISHQFSELLHVNYQEMRMISDFIIEVDTLQAKALYSKEKDLTRPNLSSEFQIELIDFFHPLIENPVKNSITVNDQKKGMIISGPNTGGKTVFLKTLTLCHLFIHFGLYVPASKATLYPVEGVFYFGNDQQNILEGLSSFTSEIKCYLTLLQEYKSTNLIVIDEIFNSTSSDEASALAISLLEHLHHTSKLQVFLSTHHQLLKTSLHKDPDYLSSHVGYDSKKQCPTYKIHIGDPGSSMAFAIFDLFSKKHNVISDITKRAAKILDNKQATYDELLQVLAQKNSSLDQLLLENRKIKKELTNRKKELEERLFFEKEKILNKYQKKVEKILEKTKDLYQRISNNEVESKKSLAREVSHIKSQIIHEAHDLTSEKKYDIQGLSTPTIDQIKEGDRFFSTILNTTVKILKINKRKKEVQINKKKLKIWCSVENLRIVPDNQNLKGDKQKIEINIERSEVPIAEIDVRGMRLEEFKHIVELSIPDLISGELPFLTIIHGHGDGILKNWLYKYIEESQELRLEKSDTNSGVSKIYLKDPS